MSLIAGQNGGFRRIHTQQCLSVPFFAYVNVLYRHRGGGLFEVEKDNAGKKTGLTGWSMAIHQDCVGGWMVDGARNNCSMFGIPR